MINTRTGFLGQPTRRTAAYGLEALRRSRGHRLVRRVRTADLTRRVVPALLRVLAAITPAPRPNLGTPPAECVDRDLSRIEGRASAACERRQWSPSHASHATSAPSRARGNAPAGVPSATHTSSHAGRRGGRRNASFRFFGARAALRFGDISPGVTRSSPGGRPESRARDFSGSSLA
jgi:hypothetical protein